MKIVSSALVLACTLVPVAARADVAPFSRPVFGQQARPAQTFVRSVAPSAGAVAYTGRIVLNISISVQSAIRSTDVIECTANVTSSDVSSAGSVRSIFDTATVAATRSGSTATCSVPVPYSWLLANASQDMVSIDYAISNVTSTNTQDLPSRYSQQTGEVVGIPKNGATTTLAIKAII